MLFEGQCFCDMLTELHDDGRPALNTSGGLLLEKPLCSSKVL